MMASRIVDAFTDITMGQIVKRCKPTKDGKFYPWLNLYNVRTQKNRLNSMNSTCLVVAGAGFEPTTFGL